VTVRVRAARADDAARVAQIYIESWNDGFGELVGYRVLDDAPIERWRHTLSSATTQWWVAEDRTEIVGFVGVGPSRDPIDVALGELDTIAVSPSHWRQGVGRALMTVALRALAAGYRDAVVWTVAGYDRGSRFYEATGWHRDAGTRADGREVSFRRSLADITDP
jgi:ribosomal protein S18 acetylase RimI-like enzyme